MRSSLIAALCAILITFGLHAQELIFNSGFERPPVVIPVSGSDQVALPLTSLTDLLVVRVLDGFGNLVSGREVSFVVTSGGGSFAEPQTTTDSNGEASAAWTLGATWGTHTVEVSAGNGTSPLIFQATTDVLGLTTEHIEQAMELDPPQGSTAPPISGTQWSLRELSQIGMHEIHKFEGNDPGQYIEDFYARRMDHVAGLLGQPVTEGIRIWMMYNHGFLVESPTGLIAFDLRDDTPSWGPTWTYELPIALLNQIDILFISHEHEDHWQDRVADAVRTAGGDVVYPAEPGSLFDLTLYGNVPMADQDTVTLSGYQITAIHGQHSAPNRIYEVTTPEGIRVMHTGDTQGSRWVPEAGVEPIDVLLINGWMNDGNSQGSGLPGMIGSINRAQPHLMIPGHYARFAGNDPPNLHKASYVTALDVVPGLPTDNRSDVQILLWGERFDYVPEQPLTVSVLTRPLPPATPGEPYSSQLIARGGDGAYSWTLAGGELPPGLNLLTGGVISGTPTLEGTWGFIVEVEDGLGETDKAALSLRVRIPIILAPQELCAGQPDEAIASFIDPDLESTVREALGLAAFEDLTCGLVTGLRDLSAESHTGIESLTGIQNLTSLMDFAAPYNDISDLSPLAGLTRLEWLSLNDNAISDISPLAEIGTLTFIGLNNNSITDISAMSGLTNLWRVYLRGNTNLSDIQPLLDNPGLVGPGDWVYLQDTNVSCADVALLQEKGVTVYHDCP